MLRAGQLNKRITIQSRSSTQDAHGQEINAWVDIAANVAAGIRPISGNERVRAMAINSQMSHVVTLRHRAAFDTPLDAGAWRIVYGTRIFNIIAVRNLNEANVTLLLDCVEGSLNGQ